MNSRPDWSLKFISYPGENEPITLAEAKAHLRVDISDDDSYIQSLIVVARTQAESIIRGTLRSTILGLYLDRFPVSNCPIIIPLPPLISINTINYLDLSGDSVLWNSTEYQVHSKGSPGAVTPKYQGCYPQTRNQLEAITINFTCGWGDNAVPKPIIQAMLLMIGHFYERREMTIVGATVSKVPQTAEYLLWPHRVLEFS